MGGTRDGEGGREGQIIMRWWYKEKGGNEKGLRELCWREISRERLEGKIKRTAERRVQGSH